MTIRKISISIYCLILIGIITFPLFNCHSKQFKDSGDAIKIEFIRRFYKSIIESDYLKAIKSTCQAQEIIRRAPQNFGIGEEEIMLMRRQFPWNRHEPLAHKGT